VSATPGSDLYRREVLQPYEQELREERMELAARVCPPSITEQRPDIDDKNARLLRLFASRIEGLIESWQEQRGKCEALDVLVAKLAHDAADVILAAKVRAKECEELSNVCVHHQGAT